MVNAKFQKTSWVLESELSNHRFYHILLTKAKHKTSSDLKDKERNYTSSDGRGCNILLQRVWTEAGVGELEAFLQTLYQDANFYI